MLYAIIIILLIVIAFLVYQLFKAKKEQLNLKNELFTFKSIVDNFPDFVYFKDKESKFIYINNAQAKLLKVKSPSEAIGKTDFEYFEEAETLFANDQQIVKTLKPQINYTHAVEFNGETIYISDTKMPMFDRDNKCIGTIGISRDISKIQKAESENTKTKVRYQAIFENAPMAIFYADSNNNILNFNRRFKELFKYETNETNQLSIAQILNDKRIAQVVTETVLATKEANFELNFRKEDRTNFIGNLTLTIIDSDSDEPVIEGIIEDISSMVKARDEIISAKDNAIKANNLKSRFLANLSHEIRTPVNAIIGFSNMLADLEILKNENQEFIEVIQGNSVLLLNLIDSIIDFSKLEGRQLKRSDTTFNFESIFNELGSNTQKMILAYGKPNLKLVLEKPEIADIKLTSDRDLLKQAIIQLLMNAVKFTNNGEIKFKYYVSNSELCISVRDTGIGILPEDQKIIFEQFVKGKNTETKVFEGTGIGLTLTAKIMEMLNGKLLLSSKENSGTEFVIKLKI